MYSAKVQDFWYSKSGISLCTDTNAPGPQSDSLRQQGSQGSEAARRFGIRKAAVAVDIIKADISAPRDFAGDIANPVVGAIRDKGVVDLKAAPFIDEDIRSGDAISIDPGGPGSVRDFHIYKAVKGGHGGIGKAKTLPVAGDMMSADKANGTVHIGAAIGSKKTSIDIQARPFSKDKRRARAQGQGRPDRDDSIDGHRRTGSDGKIAMSHKKGAVKFIAGAVETNATVEALAFIDGLTAHIDGLIGNLFDRFCAAQEQTKWK